MNIPAITTFQKKYLKIIVLSLILVLSEQQMQQQVQASGRLPDFRPFLYQWDESFNIRISLIDTTGTPLVDSHIPNTQLFRLKSMKNRPEVQEALQQGEGFSQRFSPTLSQEAIFYARLITIEKTPVILRLALPNTAMNQYLRHIDTFWIVLSMLILLVTIVCIILFGKPQNTAIQQLKAKMQSLSKGEHQKIIFYNKIALDFLQNGDEDIINLPYYDVIRNAHILSLNRIVFSEAIRHSR